MRIDPARDALGVIDVQATFMPGGELPVPDGHEVVPVANRLLARFASSFATQDWHPPGHSSFASAQPGRQPGDIVAMPYGMQRLWPDHAIQGSPGAALHPGLHASRLSHIVRKGSNPSVDSYSAFQENDRRNRTDLADWLLQRNHRRLFLCGLAADFCVAWSAEDAVAAGFDCWIVEDATRGLALPLPDGETSADVARRRLQAIGVRFITADQLEG